MATKDIFSLKGEYVGKTGAIIGSGPSILRLTKESFKDVDVVITIDYSIVRIRLLSLTQPLYVMWKDHGTLKGTPEGVCNPCPGNPPCTNRCTKVPPQSPENYIVHEHESKYCNDYYSPRYVFDNEKFGHHYGKPSAIAAIEIARLFGVSNLKMMGFDSVTTGNIQTCVDGETVLSFAGGQGYMEYVPMIKDLLAKCAFSCVEFIK